MEKGQTFLQTVPKEPGEKKKRKLYMKKQVHHKFKKYIIQRNPISKSQNNNDNDGGDNSK